MLLLWKGYIFTVLKFSHNHVYALGEYVYKLPFSDDMKFFPINDHLLKGMIRKDESTIERSKTIPLILENLRIMQQLGWKFPRDAYTYSNDSFAIFKFFYDDFLSQQDRNEDFISRQDRNEDFVSINAHADLIFYLNLFNGNKNAESFKILAFCMRHGLLTSIMNAREHGEDLLNLSKHIHPNFIIEYLQLLEELKILSREEEEESGAIEDNNTMFQYMLSNTIMINALEWLQQHGYDYPGRITLTQDDIYQVKYDIITKKPVNKTRAKDLDAYYDYVRTVLHITF